MSYASVKVPVPTGVVDHSLDAADVDKYSTEVNFLANKGHDKNDDVLLSLAADNSVNQLEKHIELNDVPKRSLIKAFCYAASAGNIANLKLLLKYVDVNDKNKTGRTALQWAARNGILESCTFLVEHGANVHYQTSDGITTLAWAVWGGNLEIVKFLVHLGADYKIINRWGCGLIHWASSIDNLPLCEYLLNLGLDFGLCNNQGHNGLMKASWNGRLGVIKYILFQTKDNLKASVEAIKSASKNVFCFNCNSKAKTNNKIISSVSKCLKQIKQIDRAGLNAVEIAFINKKLEVYDWFNKLLNGLPEFSDLIICGICQRIKLQQNDKSKNTMIESNVSKEFEIYYRTQRIIPNEHFASFKSLIGNEQPITVKISKCKAHSKSFKQDCFNKLIVVSGLSKRLESNYSIMLSKKDFLLNETFKKDVNTLQAVNIVSVDQHASETNVILTALDLKKEISEKILFLSLKYFDLLDELAHLTGEDSCILFNCWNQKHMKERTSLSRKAGMSKKALLVSANDTKFPASLKGGAFSKIVVSSDENDDGDCRIHPERLNRWSIKNVFKSHIRNFKLLKQGVKCLLKKHGSKLIFVTRSLNPLDNEAVVGAVLNFFQGQVELIEVDSAGNNGLTSWCVPDETVVKGHSLFRYLTSYKEVTDANRWPNGLLRESMFMQNSEINQELLKCKRMSPLNDSSSGCFFIAVFIPKIEVLVKCSESYLKIESTSSDEMFNTLSHFYDLETSKHWLLSPTNSVKLVSKGVLQVYNNMIHNERIKILDFGLELFVQINGLTRSVSCPWRPSLQGCWQLVLGFRFKRKIVFDWIEEGHKFCPSLFTLLVNRELKLTPALEKEIQSEFGSGGFLLGIREKNNFQVKIWLSCVLTANKILLCVDKRMIKTLLFILH